MVCESVDDRNPGPQVPSCCTICVVNQKSAQHDASGEELSEKVAATGVAYFVHMVGLLAATLFSSTGFFIATQAPLPAPRLTHAKMSLSDERPIFGDPLELGDRAEAAAAPPDARLAALGVAALLASAPEAAQAKGGEFGVFEGRIISLAHPTIMAFVYGLSAFSAFTGWQWRQLREIGTEITAVKAELKELEAKAVVAEGETAPASLVASISEHQAKVDALTATRKELAQGDFRDKHYQAGALVLGIGTSFAIEGPVNTFLRAQKLFPGPHLYAGAGIVVCWALAASLVPLMQKGNSQDAARYGHMAFNGLALALFTWQCVLRPLNEMRTYSPLFF